MKSRGAVSVLALVCLGMLQPGCGEAAPSDEQQVTDAVNAYNTALVAGDRKTACGYVTAASRRRFGARDRNGSRISCVRQVGYLPQNPGVIKDLSVTRVAVHGRKARAHAESPSKAAVTAEYELVKHGGQWKITYIFSTS